MLSVFATPYFDGLVQERRNSSASLEFNERKTFSEIGHLETLTIFRKSFRIRHNNNSFTGADSWAEVIQLINVPKLDIRIDVFKFCVSASYEKHFVMRIRCHLYAFISYSSVELKLWFNPKSLAKQALNSLSSLLGLNSLRPSDAIWRQWSWTTLAQVMACCLTAPSHYLNQCWLIIRGVLWHTSESSFAGIAQGIDSGYEFEKDILKNIFKSPRGQWVNEHSAHHRRTTTSVQHAPIMCVWPLKWPWISLISD